MQTLADKPPVARPERSDDRRLTSRDVRPHRLADSAPLPEGEELRAAFPPPRPQTPARGGDGRGGRMLPAKRGRGRRGARGGAQAIEDRVGVRDTTTTKEIPAAE